MGGIRRELHEESVNHACLILQAGSYYSRLQEVLHRSPPATAITKMKIALPGKLSDSGPQSWGAYVMLFLIHTLSLGLFSWPPKPPRNIYFTDS